MKKDIYGIIKPSSIGIFILSTAIALFLTQNKVFSQADLPLTDKIKFKGKIVEDKDISAIGFVDQYILIGADEGNTIQVLEPNKKKSKYRVARNIKLLENGGKAEVDVEGIAVFGNTVYVVGSHSNQQETKSNENNRKNVFRLQLNPDTGKLESSIEKESLQTILSQDKVLSQFATIPYERNGIDIEGIAVKKDRLYFGFRTPILQGNYVPVIATKFEDINRTDKYELHCINLDGGGIRDIVAVNEGFLILADVVGDSESDYRLYFWDGSDELSKSDKTSAVKLLSEIPAKKNTRAEGLTILMETDSSYRILIVYDGVAEGNPTTFEIQK